MVNQSQYIHDYYECNEFPDFCTSFELSAKQWGGSAITMNISEALQMTPFLNKTGLSVKEVWGLGEVAPEYNFYSETFLDGKQQFKIPTISVFKIFNNITGLFSVQKASVFIVNVT